MPPVNYIYIAVVIFVLIYRMYRNAVKAQKGSTSSSRVVPEQRQAQQQQVDQWLRQVVLSNQMQAQFTPPPQPVVSPYASYSQEQIVDEVAYDTEIAIETELYQFDHRNTSPQNDPDGLNFAASTSTSLPAAETSDWQNAVIMSELLGPPKGLQ
jgi:hypothetical protein